MAILVAHFATLGLESVGQHGCVEPIAGISAKCCAWSIMGWCSVTAMDAESHTCLMIELVYTRVSCESCVGNIACGLAPVYLPVLNSPAAATASVMPVRFNAPRTISRLLCSLIGANSR